MHNLRRIATLQTTPPSFAPSKNDNALICLLCTMHALCERENNNQALCFACISINSILYNRNRRNSGSSRGKAPFIGAVRAIDSLFLVVVVLVCAVACFDVC